MSSEQSVGMSAKRIIVVLGMHRSGTSAITRSLMTLGVGLGDRLMPAKPDNNDKGFWEDLDIFDLNVALLRQLGLEWDSLAPIAAADLTGAGMDAFVDRAAAMLEQKLTATPVLGIKDPRMTRLLPFWERVFAHIVIQPDYVIALRHPLSVADSLARRDSFEPIKSHLLWLQHMIAALQGRTGKRCLVVSYDHLLARPAVEMARIGQMLGLDFDATSADFREFSESFLEEGLRHARHEDAALQDSAGVPAEVSAAYQLLDRLASDDIALEATGVAAELIGFESFLEKNALQLAYMARGDKKIADLTLSVAVQQGQLDELRRTVVERESALTMLGAAVTDRDARIVSLGQSVAERESQLATLSGAVTDRDARIVSLGQSVAERDGKIASLGVMVAERDGKIASLGVMVAERDGQIASFSAAVTERDGRIAALSNRLNEIYHSTGWRLLAPLRWYGRQRQRIRVLRQLVPHAVSRAGGLLPLARYAVRVLRHDGVSGFRSLLRHHAAQAAVVTPPPVSMSAPVSVSEPVREISSCQEILFVSHEASRTGAPVLLLDVARLLRDRLGVSCTFLLCSGGVLEEQFRQLGKTWVLAHRHEVDPVTLQAFKQRNIKLVYSNTATNGLVQRQLREIGCPVLCHVHELGFSLERHFGAENLKALWATTDFFLAGSGAVADYLVKRPHISPANMQVAHPFIDVSANDRVLARAERPLDLPSGAVVVGACGTVCWRKGTDLFVQVVRRVLDRTDRHIHFVWLGGPLGHGEFQNAQYDAEVLGVMDRVSFTGPVASHLPYFSQFDIFLLPSREDPFPLVVLDAAAAGIPVVCFDHAGGAPEVVEADAGRVVPYLDLERMAEAVVSLAEDADLRHQLGQTARAKVKSRHDVDVGGNRIVDIVASRLNLSQKDVT